MQTATGASLSKMSDGEVLDLLLAGNISVHRLEDDVGDVGRAVRLRRMFLAAEIDNKDKTDGSQSGAAIDNIPIDSFDSQEFYGSVYGSNCESVIG